MAKSINKFSSTNVSLIFLLIVALFGQKNYLSVQAQGFNDVFTGGAGSLINPLVGGIKPVVSSLLGGGAASAASSSSSSSQSTKTSASSASNSALGIGAGLLPVLGAGSSSSSTSASSSSSSSSNSASSSSSNFGGLIQSPSLLGSELAAPYHGYAGPLPTSFGYGNPLAAIPNVPHPLAPAVANPLVAAAETDGAIKNAALLGASNAIASAPALNPFSHAATLGAASALSDTAASTGVLGATGALDAAVATGATTAASEESMINPIGSMSGLARQGLATDALSNAQAESAIAGADMVAHGANNARSASLASNAYRQAKLASARDRVNIAGTIQNSARISDAAIATHDAATKAEDSLLGSELAVDSAATVLDSDGAYIPPVTSSLLRSLPYGRLGIRNIVPKPLTYPSVLLPDVWLNGVPVSYLNVPLRMPPYGLSSTPYTNQLYAAGANLVGGNWATNQILSPNNGLPLNSRYFDPSAAYIVGAARGVIDSSILPVLANGQLEAHDEVALANMLRVQQENGPGMLSTHGGYGKLNQVPMLTGTVSDMNLMPTSTTGTTYPIGSALVIEPRDSFFQDYIDSASSRQNFDERQQ